MDLTGVTWRWHPGDETQLPDPLIAAIEGADGDAGLSRHGLCGLRGPALERYGNRMPQLNFEVFRPLADPATAEGRARRRAGPGVRRVRLATEAIRKGAAGETRRGEPERARARARPRRLARPAAGERAEGRERRLVVAWFGDDLRCDRCSSGRRSSRRRRTATPRAGWSSTASSAAPRAWSARSTGRPVFGGTPADSPVLQAIPELKARGLRGDVLSVHPDGHPGRQRAAGPVDGAAETGQPPVPWRGRITLAGAGLRRASSTRPRRRATRSRRSSARRSARDFARLGRDASAGPAAGEWSCGGSSCTMRISARRRAGSTPSASARRCAG